MRLTVLNVAYPLAQVGPDAVGGAEQVLSQLDAGLVCAGHQSLVIAAFGSTAAGTLLATPCWQGHLDPQTRKLAADHHGKAILHALTNWDVDVVHLHGIDFLQYLPPTGVAVLITLHLPSSWYEPEVFRLTRPRTFLHCVSASQQRLCPAGPQILPWIHNGISEQLFSARHARRNFALSLGRICPEKGFHLALDAARSVNVPLVLAGQVFSYPEHEAYFQQQIAPRLTGGNRFIGPVGLRRKRRLLAGARCLVAPSLVAETSSLVAMEALACGTPVVAFRSGALAELIDHGRTGFLVNNERELAQAIRAAPSIDRELCRKAAANRFSGQEMVSKYLAIYAALARSEAHSNNRSLGVATNQTSADGLEQPRSPALG